VPKVATLHDFQRFLHCAEVACTSLARLKDEGKLDPFAVSQMMWVEEKRETHTPCIYIAVWHKLHQCFTSGCNQ